MSETNKYWKFDNPNPSQKYKKNGNPYQWKKPDCSVRAIAFSLGTDWLTAYNILYDIGRDLLDVPNSLPVMETALQKYGVEKHVCKIQKGEKRPTVNDIAKQSKNSVFFANLANHCVCIKNGYFYDTWDCGNLSVYSYWEKKI